MPTNVGLRFIEGTPFQVGLKETEGKPNIILPRMGVSEHWGPIPPGR